MPIHAELQAIIEVIRLTIARLQMPEKIKLKLITVADSSTRTTSFQPA
jgi:hypothetical protein